LGSSRVIASIVGVAQCAWREAAAVAAVPATAMPSGGSGPNRRGPARMDYREADKPLIAEMQVMIQTGRARNVTDAARVLAGKATGNGNEASKVKRLIRLAEWRRRRRAAHAPNYAPASRTPTRRPPAVGGARDGEPRCGAL
ncbi:MAG: hypothetical protein ACREFY_05520, partial [Acetobacteraceae bacterium]